MTTTEQNGGSNRRNQVMVGELPEDFLRVPSCMTQQQQVMGDERVAQILQAQQQSRFAAVPANVSGKINISIGQAKLAKNYGLTKMDPYVRVRVGHSVFETPTAYNGAKNPQWNKDVSIFLPKGVDCLYLEIFDERQFTMDNRIAWAYITIPPAALNGDTVQNWFPLTGRQGDQKEGTISLVFTYTPIENMPATQYAYPQPVAVQPAVYYPQPLTNVVYPPQQQPPTQPPVPQGPLYTEEDLKQVKDMFPNMEEEVIKSVFEANRGNKDSSINALLQMSSD